MKEKQCPKRPSIATYMKASPYILLIVHFQAWTVGKHKVYVRSSLIRSRLVQWSSSDKLFSREEHESTRLNDHALLEGPYSTWYLLDSIQLTTIGTVLYCTIEPVVDLQSWSFIETLTLNKQWKTTYTMWRETRSAVSIYSFGLIMQGTLSVHHSWTYVQGKVTILHNSQRNISPSNAISVLAFNDSSRATLLFLSVSSIMRSMGWLCTWDWRPSLMHCPVVWSFVPKQSAKSGSMNFTQ